MACLLRQMGHIFCINRGATIYFFINEGGMESGFFDFAQNDEVRAIDNRRYRRGVRAWRS